MLALFSIRIEGRNVTVMLGPMALAQNENLCRRNANEVRTWTRATVLSTKRVKWVVFKSFDIFSVMVHAIETKKHTNMIPKDY